MRLMVRCPGGRASPRVGRRQWADPRQQLSRAALAARAHWLTVEWLPKYAPELNDIEVVWHDLKAYQLAHKTITDVVELNDAIHTAVSDLNRERMTVPLANPESLLRADRSAEADPLNVLTSPLFECFQRNVVAIDEIGAPVRASAKAKAHVLFIITFSSLCRALARQQGFNAWGMSW